MMSRKTVPRPASVSAAGYIMVLMFFVGAIHGLYLVNADFFEQRLVDVLPYVFPAPLLMGFCAIFVFRGANWARVLFWVSVGPVAVTALLVLGDLFGVLYTLAYLGAGLLLATKNAGWFFMGRDYRRRPGYRPSFDRRAKEAGGRKRFEY